MKKFLRFLVISGGGWLLDFGIYSLLTMVLELPVWLSNFISSFAAISFVFFTATRHAFVLHKGGLSLRQKYLAYLMYQLVLVSAVSFLAQWLALDLLPELALRLSGNPVLADSGASVPALYRIALDYGRMIAKIIITPITMICNFFVLGWITEKL
jgi:putative flippase GtrA